MLEFSQGLTLSVNLMAGLKPWESSSIVQTQSIEDT